ncbi:MAG TPA: hypothetical protein VN951_01980 [Pyrinomonadaceae bacterium]|nr:hypothetical protein [Pyrinomonadaceae bacterium]
MFCPQCSTESSGQPYCRSCGANLKVIGKAVTLSEAIGRSDRGPLPKIKEMMKNFKAEQVTEEVSHALEQMNTEIVRSTGKIKQRGPKFPLRRQKTPAERRENLLVKGTISIFSGAGLTLFLYFLTHAINLHLPADVIANIPFEVDPVVRVLWLVGLIPAFAGVGRLLAAMSIKVNKQDRIADKLSESVGTPVLKADTARDLYAPPSVTERTTNLLSKS